MALGFISNAYHSVTHGLSSAASSVASTVSSASSDVADVASDAGHDVVSFSDEALNQTEKFGSGVGDWGVGAYDTAKTLITHPIESAEAIGKLATNPLLNPVAGLTSLATNAIEGKNPLDGYKNGASQLETLGKAVAGDYTSEYKKNGAAGVAGYVLPDILLTLATDGGEAAGKGAAEVAGKAAAEGVAEDAAKTAGEDAAKSGISSTLKSGAQKAGELGSKQLKNYTDSTFANSLKGLFSKAGEEGAAGTGRHAATQAVEKAAGGAAHEAKHAAEEGGAREVVTKLAKGAVPSKSAVSAHNTNDNSSNNSGHHSLIGGLAHSFASIF